MELWLPRAVVRLPHGALFHNASASAPNAFPPIAYISISSPSVSPSTRRHDVSTRPLSARMPMIEGMPPARFTSSMWYLELGATLQSTGVFLDRTSMSFIVKSTPASLATASRWSTVLVLPPMAMSSVMALSIAWRVAIERGSTLASSSK